MAETASNDRQRERDALAYLRDQLDDRAPRSLTPEASFAEAPLEDEGPATVFSFDLPAADAACVTAGASPRHYVVSGSTRPNYFPAYGLDPDDAYSLHIGTRFMLDMQIGLADPADEPSAARDAMCSTVRQVAPDIAIQDESLAALFRASDALYAVYRLRVGGEPVYFLGADCPPGFYRMADLPPQVVLRLHLGKLIRAERSGPG
jgi:hypothetical protein